jgi:antirestriction protein
MKDTVITPRIYVACLASYNNGILYGCWINVMEGVGHVYEEVTKMLANSPICNSEEYAIHDYEGFYDLRLEEYESFASVFQKAELISEYGKISCQVLDYWGGDIEEAKRMLEDGYMGKWESIADYTRNFLYETGTLTNSQQHLVDYINFNDMGKDMECAGDILTFETGYKEIHIFSGYY